MTPVGAVAGFKDGPTYKYDPKDSKTGDVTRADFVKSTITGNLEEVSATMSDYVLTLYARLGRLYRGKVVREFT